MSQEPNDLISFKNSQGVVVRATLVKVTRQNIVLEVYNPYSIVQLSEKLDDLCIRKNDRIIYQGRAVVSNLLNTGLMLVVSATLVDAWSDLSGLLDDKLGIKDEVEKFIVDWDHNNQLSPSFQLAVGEMRSLLSELSRWLEQVDLVAGQDGVLDSPTLHRELLQDLTSPLLPRLHEQLQKFEHEAAQVPDEFTVMHRSFLQRDLHPLLMRTPFVHRTFHKPLGYAGDYEMVNMMLRDPYEGPTSYAKLVNSFFLTVGPVVAHQNRIQILQQQLHEIASKAAQEHRPARILNIGCGPAIEVQRFIRGNALCQQCEFTLLDFSEETLNYTKGQLERAMSDSGNKVQIEYLHKSVHSLLKQASEQETEQNNHYDLVYCAGLFDYLSDRVCSRLLRLFYQWAKDDGYVLASNVHSNNNALYMMEYIMEWHLIYRDEANMEKLVPELGKQRIYAEATGMNIFLEIIKTDTD